MTMKTMFDIIFSRNPEALKAALEAHKNVTTDTAEETIITQFLEEMELVDGDYRKHYGPNN